MQKLKKDPPGGESRRVGEEKPEEELMGNMLYPYYEQKIMDYA